MRPLITFFTLAYLISWGIWLPLYSTKIGLPELPVIPFHHALGGLGPMIAAIVTTALFEKKAGVQQLLSRFIRLRPLIYLIVALFSPFVLVVIAFLIGYFFNGTTPNWEEMLHSSEFPEFNIIIFFFYNLLFFGFGEETGWRGFALPRFEQRFSPLAATLILTVFWALWHLPLFAYRPGYTSMGAGGITGWLFSLLTGSVLLSWLYHKSRFSILICAIFHATVDIAFTANFSDTNMVGYTGFLITLWGIVTLLFFRSIKRSINH